MTSKCDNRLTSSNRVAANPYLVGICFSILLLPISSTLLIAAVYCPSAREPAFIKSINKSFSTTLCKANYLYIWIRASSLAKLLPLPLSLKTTCVD